MYLYENRSDFGFLTYGIATADGGSKYWISPYPRLSAFICG